MKGVSKTIIVGAGIAGLGCARTLYDNHEDFLLISENIGGRILMSKDGKVPYGAYFIANDYKHTQKYFHKERKLSIFTLGFNNGAYTARRCITNPIETVRIILEIQKFRKHYTNFKKRCLIISQKEAIEENTYLHYLYQQNALDYMLKIGVVRITKKFLSQASYGLLFCPMEKISAFEFLRWIQYLLIPKYEFTFLKDKLLDGFTSSIITDSVTSINYGNLFSVKTKLGNTYHAHNIVIATPTAVAADLLGFQTHKEPATAYMFHVKGNLKNVHKKLDFLLYPEGSPIYDIARQCDGTYLFYCDHEHPNLGKYFYDFKVMAKKHWNPAFNIIGHKLLACEHTPNLFLIGDHNICGMEDAFITGMYAAKKITDRVEL